MLGALGGAFMLLSGSYETAATHQHFALTHRLLETGLRISVSRSARSLAPAPTFTPAHLQAGAACFRDHCAACHGAPGIAPGAHALGMLPLPTSLVQASRDWSEPELYWIISKGVRMTGMPAWEYRLSAASRWSVVAFLQAMPALDAAGWQRLAATAPADACTGATGRADLATERDPPDEMSAVSLRQYGCTGCHQIDGVVGPAMHVGPPLTDWRSRRYIAGMLPNNVPNLARFIEDPDSISPGTLMPDLGVPAEQARHMARYLLGEQGP